MVQGKEPNAEGDWDELDQAVNVLHWLTVSTGQRAERSVVLRALVEAQAAIPGEDGATWIRRMIDVSDRFRFRLVQGEGKFRDVAAFFSERMSGAIRLEEHESGAHWLIVERIDGRIAYVRWSHRPGQIQRISVRKLSSWVGGYKAKVRWVLSQKVLADASNPDRKGDGAGHHEMQPTARLLALIAPERSDVVSIVIFSVVVGLLTLATPLAVEAIVNTVAFGRTSTPILVLSFMVFVFLGFSAGIRALLALIAEIIQRRLFVRVVEDLAYRLPRVRYEVMREKFVPEYVNRFFDVVTVQKTFSSLMLDGISIVLQTFIGMAVLAFYHPFLLGFDIVLLASMTFVVFVLGRGAVKTAIKESKAKYAVAGWLEEMGHHGTAFRTYSGRRLALDRADALATHYLEYRRSHFRVLMRQTVFALLMQAVAATVLLGLGGWLVITGELTLGQLVAAELIVTVIVGNFAKIGKHLESYYDLLASVDKLGGLFDLPLEDEPRWTHPPDDGPVRLKISGIGVVGEDGRVIDTLEIAAGQSISIQGQARSGKSRLLEAMAGFGTPLGCIVQIQGVDTHEIRRDTLDGLVGLANQIEIFHGTLAENVHLGRSTVRQADVRRALELVELGEEVDRLPEGIECELQTHGTILSTTERARLMIARAIAGHPRLLLIDGLLDWLPDEQAERILQRLIDSREGMTVVLVTGRRALQSMVDRVVTLIQVPELERDHESTDQPLNS